jgi:ubiquinol-cytochrome c reductase iron-sulfur subunit
MSDEQHTGPGRIHDADRDGSTNVPATDHGPSNTEIAGAARQPGESGEHAATTGAELEARFADPGLPAHVYRRSDIDPRAAKRREREVAMLFGLSTLGTLTFIVGYFAVKLAGQEGNELLSRVSLSTKLLGAGLGVALFCIGAGAIHWAKTLMPDDEIAIARKPMRSPDDVREAAVETLKEGAAGAGLGRRKLIRNSLLGALAPLGLLAIIPLRDLGPLPGKQLNHTFWGPGRRLVTDPTGHPIKASDIPLGGVVHVQPEGIDETEHPIDERAKAATLVIRLNPEDLKQHKNRESWTYNGIVAYSKICTHVGCPVGLYEQQTHHLLCPCHQSTFDVTNHCAVIFGPAARPLPQLPISVDSDGYLIATSDYKEPVGPSFWERS